MNLYLIGELSQEITWNFFEMFKFKILVNSIEGINCHFLPSLGYLPLFPSSTWQQVVCVSPLSFSMGNGSDRSDPSSRLRWIGDLDPSLVNFMQFSRVGQVGQVVFRWTGLKFRPVWVNFKTLIPTPWPSAWRARAFVIEGCVWDWEWAIGQCMLL